MTNKSEIEETSSLIKSNYNNGLFKVFSHSIYLINLCHSSEDEKCAKALQNLKWELVNCSKLDSGINAVLIPAFLAPFNFASLVSKTTRE